MVVTLELLQTFLRQPPPRQVPPQIRRQAFQRTPRVLLWVGWLLILMGAVFVGIFFPLRLSSDLALSLNGRPTRGRVISTRVTAYTENNRRVIEYRFEYEAPGGPYSSLCYSSSVALNENEDVDVLYLPSQPTIARIKECRLSKFGWGAGAVAIMPGIGVGMIFFTRRSQKRIAALLVHGRFALGRIADITETAMQVNRQPVYRVSVLFTTDLGREVMARYNVIGYEYVCAAQEKRNTNTSVGVLYDPAHPNRVLLVDDLLLG